MARIFWQAGRQTGRRTVTVRVSIYLGFYYYYFACVLLFYYIHIYIPYDSGS